ncbi:MAG: efflux RND transporter periplasmic adaptor subunit [Cyanobacteria bacterium J06633_2]
MSSDLNSATFDRSVKSKQDQYWRYRWLLWVMIGVFAGGGFVWFTSRGNREVVATETVAQGPPPRPVEVTQLAAGEGVRSVELIGQVEARTSATVRSQTAGVVQQVLVEPGDTVESGTTIAVLDEADQRLSLAQAQASLASERSTLAELEVGTRPEIIEQRRASLQSAEVRQQEALDNLERTQELVNEGALSERTLIESRAAVDAAQASRLEAAAALAEATAGPTNEEIAAQRAIVAANQAAVDQMQLALSRTQIQATVAGTVESRIANIGDYLEVGDPIVSMIDRSNLDIFLEIPEDLAGQISPGLTVELTARALPDWRGQATIVGIIPTADEASRRQRVRLQVTSPPASLLPGMAIQGELELPSNTSGFTVSRDSLVQRAGEWMVFAVEDDQVQAIDVEILADMGTSMAIASDQLRDDQSIVIRGAEGLQDGAAVNVMEEGE